MIIYKEESLGDFEFWGYAEHTANAFTWQELDMIESELECLHPDGIDEIYLNELFCHEVDYVAQLAGYRDFAEVLGEEDEEDKQ